eukprot:scaffold193631_cov32-Tisochrysis_lutea.AAC.5
MRGATAAHIYARRLRRAVNDEASDSELSTSDGTQALASGSGHSPTIRGERSNATGQLCDGYGGTLPFPCADIVEGHDSKGDDEASEPCCAIEGIVATCRAPVSAGETERQYWMRRACYGREDGTWEPQSVIAHTEAFATWTAAESTLPPCTTSTLTAAEEVRKRTAEDAARLKAAAAAASADAEAALEAAREKCSLAEKLREQARRAGEAAEAAAVMAEAAARAQPQAIVTFTSADRQDGTAIEPSLAGSLLVAPPVPAPSISEGSQATTVMPKDTPQVQQSELETAVATVAPSCEEEGMTIFNVTRSSSKKPVDTFVPDTRPAKDIDERPDVEEFLSQSRDFEAQGCEAVELVSPLRKRPRADGEEDVLYIPPGGEVADATQTILMAGAPSKCLSTVAGEECSQGSLSTVDPDATSEARVPKSRRVMGCTKCRYATNGCRVCRPPSWTPPARAPGRAAKEAPIAPRPVLILGGRSGSAFTDVPNGASPCREVDGTGMNASGHVSRPRHPPVVKTRENVREPIAVPEVDTGDGLVWKRVVYPDKPLQGIAPPAYALVAKPPWIAH